MDQTTITPTETAPKKNNLRHHEVLEKLRLNAEHNPNAVGFMVFGSVASNTHHEKSEIDTITVLKENKPKSGIIDTVIDGIKVGDLFLTLDVLEHSVENVPYLLHPVMKAKLLLDKENRLQSMIDQLGDYYSVHPDVEDEWAGYYEQLREEKKLYGYERTTIVDVWNKLETEHPDSDRRRFFDAFYLRSPFVFGIVKRLLVSGFLAKEFFSR